MLDLKLNHILVLLGMIRITQLHVRRPMGLRNVSGGSSSGSAAANEVKEMQRTRGFCLSWEVGIRASRFFHLHFVKEIMRGEGAMPI